MDCNLVQSAVTAVLVTMLSFQALHRFREVWLLDFEFTAATGERPVPICLVAREARSGRTIRLFGSDLTGLTVPPFDVGPNSLFVAYYASAEMSCFLALGWPLPVNVLDLYVEFRCMTNELRPRAPRRGGEGREATHSGLATPQGRGLLGALTYFGLPALAAVEKDEMRALAIRGAPFTTDEAAALLAYCETDVDALGLLLPRMVAKVDIERALLRGRYMKAAARMEYTGVPVDQGAFETLKTNWVAIQDRLVTKVDAGFGIYDGRTFKVTNFAAWLQRMAIPWPHHDSGVLDLSDAAFRDMARAHPSVAPLRELRHALSDLRLNDLAVGRDGRNRCLLSAFQARTGRNQPSNSKFIFGPAVWLRGLIKPSPDRAIAYVDWSQQEFGIAAALSGDEAMQAAYQSGDPYLEFAKQAGAVPLSATKESHATTREQFKSCALGVQYGMAEAALALRLGQPVAHARELLRLHRSTYPKFWSWNEAAVMHAMLHGELWTTFGWTVHVGPEANPRALGNFPMQGNGAEMLRLACCFATERGINVCAPVHDALLVEAPVEKIDAVVEQTQASMEQASAIVLGGFRLRSEAKVVRFPDRYMDRRGEAMWRAVWTTIGEVGR